MSQSSATLEKHKGEPKDPPKHRGNPAPEPTPPAPSK
jgi:hypothetical protein